jgi:hypothetical protein
MSVYIKGGRFSAICAWLLLVAFLGQLYPTFAQNGPQGQPPRPGYPYRYQQFPREPDEIPPETTPPPAPMVKVPAGQTLASYRFQLARENLQKAGQTPYRIVNGQPFNLQPLTNFLGWVYDNADNESLLKTRQRSLPEWSLLHGRVAQITEQGGVFLWEYSNPEMSSTPRLIRIRNYPGQKMLIDGETLTVFAKREPNYSYIATTHARATIESYDHGNVATLQDMTRIQSANTLGLNHPIPKQQPVRPTVNRGRMIELRKQQATNNVASAQYEVGAMYLNGTGVESNRALSIYWLTRAATNGHAGASNLLSTLTGQP